MWTMQFLGRNPFPRSQTQIVQRHARRNVRKRYILRFDWLIIDGPIITVLTDWQTDNWLTDILILCTWQTYYWRTECRLSDQLIIDWLADYWLTGFLTLCIHFHCSLCIVARKLCIVPKLTVKPRTNLPLLFQIQAPEHENPPKHRTLGRRTTVSDFVCLG